MLESDPSPEKSWPPGQERTPAGPEPRQPYRGAVLEFEFARQVWACASFKHVS